MSVGSMFRALLIGGLLSGGGAGAAYAHHSFGAEFDASRPLVLQGVVTRFDWRNPHSEIHLDVVNRKTGQHALWRIEGGAPSALLRRHWNRMSLPPGTAVAVRAFPAWDGDNRASAAEITFPNGTTVSLANPQTQAAEALSARSRPEEGPFGGR